MAKKKKDDDYDTSRRDSIETLTQNSYLESLSTDPHSPQSPWKASLSPQPRSPVKDDDEPSLDEDDGFDASDDQVEPPNLQDFKAIPYATLLSRQPSLAIKYAPNPSFDERHIVIQDIVYQVTSLQLCEQSPHVVPPGMTLPIVSLSAARRWTLGVTHPTSCSSSL